MRLRDLIKYKKRVEKLPQYTPKSDLPRATKEMKERNLKEFWSKEKKPKDFLSREEKLNRGLERAYERKDKKALGSWLKAWAKDDRRELRNLEKDLMRD